MLLVVTVSTLILIMIVPATWLMVRTEPDMAVSGRFSVLNRDLQNQTEIEKNLAVGLLENGQFLEAEKKFSAIAALLPDETLAIRNLTIARLLAQESGLMDLVPVQQAVDQLLKKDVGSAVTHVLAGRTAKLAGNSEAAVSEFQRAVELSPDDPSFLWEAFQASQGTTDSQQNDGRQALDRAFGIEPNNLFLLTELLLAQAKSHDTQIETTLKDAYEKLKWLTDSVRMQNQIELPGLLDQATAAVSRREWPAAMNSVRILSNVLRPQPATQSDRMRIQKHAMEFVLRDFPPLSDTGGTEDHKADPARGIRVSDQSSTIDVEFLFSQVTCPDRPLTGIVSGELADMDLDAIPEVIVVHDQGVTILKQHNESPEWNVLSEFATKSSLSGAILADLDQDLVDRPKLAEPVSNSSTLEPVCHEADLDMVLYGAQGVTVLENRIVAANSQRELAAVTQGEAFSNLRGVMAVIASDLDHDGDLDLAISSSTGISVWTGRGDLTFIDITGNSQIPPAALKVTSMSAIDIDQDIDTDILVGSQSQPLGYLENIGHGRFRWLTLPESDQSSVAANSLTAFGSNPQRSWNLLFAGPRGAFLMPTICPQMGLVRCESAQQITNVPANGLMKWDYDNDGWTDVVTWSGNEARLFRGEPDDQFRDVSHLLKPKELPGEIRVCRSTDIDRDGDLDLFLTQSDGITLLKNQGGNQNSWLNVSLRAEQEKGGQVSASGRVNHYGAGSVLELRSGQRYQSQVAENSMMHFGLGKQKPDLVRVLWTNGVPANIIHPTPELQICERQTLKGSCPYLYTWNGSEFEFYTDLLWSAPLGLQFAEGVYAPARNWEYLRIAGENLQEKDGHYQLQVTEELWEAAYFDQIRLLAVDHPADTEIYSNEKVGPAEIAAFRIHTVRKPRAPVSAVDQKGRDVLERIRHRDGKYLKAFDQKLRQGLTEEHVLELDPGHLEDPARIMLFLAGWIYPTDTSINVALGQSRELKGPMPPSLWVPDADGQWCEAIPYMGFPGGKTKTIAVDLTNVFRSDDRRLQIRTTAEIYWDHAFFTIDDPEAEYLVTPLNLSSADLRYRGFSAMTPDPEYGPETYDYASVDTSAHWPPMQGQFTKYGNVIELLGAEDDRLVIMGSGDELSVRFAIPQLPVRPGWKRDFLMHNIGWDKDADLNTVYGQTVEPLPFGKMSGYPYRWDEAFPTTELHENYLKTYQIRRQFSGSFRRFPARR